MSSFLNLRQEFPLNLNTVIGNNDGMTVIKGHSVIYYLSDCVSYVRNSEWGATEFSESTKEVDFY